MFAILLTACGDDAAKVAAHPFAKVWSQPYDHSTWDWTRASVGQDFQAPLTLLAGVDANGASFAGGVCDCTIELTGDLKNGTMTVSCVSRPGPTEYPYCSDYNNRDTYQYNGPTDMLIYASSGMGVQAEWR